MTTVVRRKIVDMVDVPYDTYPDGKPRTIQMYVLECGHRVKRWTKSQVGSRLKGTPEPLKDFHNCMRCDKEIQDGK